MRFPPILDRHAKVRMRSSRIRPVHMRMYLYRKMLAVGIGCRTYNKRAYVSHMQSSLGGSQMLNSDAIKKGRNLAPPNEGYLAGYH